MTGDWPKHNGGGWWECSDGAVLRGQDRAQAHQSGIGPNLTALHTTLRELERIGRLEPVDAAQVQTLLSLAEVLDRRPQESRLWGQYRGALRDLREAGDEVDDELDRALAALRSAAEVGDSPET